MRVENAVPRPIPKDFDSLRVSLKHKPGNLHFLQSPPGDSDAGGPRCTIVSRETKYLKQPCSSRQKLLELMLTKIHSRSKVMPVFVGLYH